MAQKKVAPIDSEQGSPSDAVCYLEKGKVKLTVLSPRGKEEAVVAILGSSDFFGEGSLARQRFVWFNDRDDRVRDPSNTEGDNIGDAGKPRGVGPSS